MKLICPFTVNIYQTDYQNSIRERNNFLLKNFAKTNLQFHKIILLTDKDSLNYLTIPEGIEIQLSDTTQYRLIDDFKLDLLPKLKKDEVIIDFDVYLFKPLPDLSEYDVVIERYEEEFAFEIYQKLISSITNKEIKDYFLSINALKTIPNIGVFKINNADILKEYREKFYYYSNLFITHSESSNTDPTSYSALFSQYILNDVLSNKNLKIFTGNKYGVHLNGEQKYTLTENQLYRRISQKKVLL